MHDTEHSTTSPTFDPHASTIPHMPDPSIFPLIISIGMTILPLGLLLGLWVFIVGLIVFAIGLGGWLYEDTQTHLKARKHKH